MFVLRFGRYWEVLESDKAKVEKEKEKKKEKEVNASNINQNAETSAFLAQDKDSGQTNGLQAVASKEDGELSVEIKDGKNENANANNRRGVKSGVEALKRRFKKTKSEAEKPKETMFSVQRGGLRSLVNTLFRSFGKTFIAATFFKLCHDILVFVPPYLLKQLIYYIRAVQAAKANLSNQTDASSTDEDVGNQIWKGYFFAAMLMVSCILQTIMLHQYFHRTFLVGRLFNIHVYD